MAATAADERGEQCSHRSLAGALDDLMMDENDGVRTEFSSWLRPGGDGDGDDEDAFIDEESQKTGSRRSAVPELAISEATQLLQMGLYPASWKRPRTAFTLHVLRSYHLLSLQSQISALDYFTYLKRTTDNVAPDSVPVSVCHYRNVRAV